MKLDVPYFKQDTNYTCGPVAIQMALSYLDFFKSEEEIAREARTNKQIGTTHEAMIEVVRKEGFYCYVNSESSLEEVEYFLKQGLPVIIHFTEPSTEDGHYAVITGIEKRSVILNDPWNGGDFSMNEQNFVSRWRAVLAGVEHVRWMLVISKTNFELGKQYTPYFVE